MNQYDEYLATLGITRGSDEEIELLQKVFGLDFDDDEDGCGCDEAGCGCGPSCQCGGDHSECGDDCDCDEGEFEEMTDDDLLVEVKAWMEKQKA